MQPFKMLNILVEQSQFSMFSHLTQLHAINIIVKCFHAYFRIRFTVSKNVFDFFNIKSECRDLRDRSFFMRGGADLGGGALEKIGLKGGASRKKNEGKGGGRTKKLD